MLALQQYKLWHAKLILSTTEESPFWSEMVVRIKKWDLRKDGIEARGRMGRKMRRLSLETRPCLQTVLDIDTTYLLVKER